MADLLDEYSMVSFLPLDISEEERYASSMPLCQASSMTSDRLLLALSCVLIKLPCGCKSTYSELSACFFYPALHDQHPRNDPDAYESQ